MLHIFSTVSSIHTHIIEDRNYVSNSCWFIQTNIEDRIHVSLCWFIQTKFLFSFLSQKDSKHELDVLNQISLIFKWSQLQVAENQG